MTKDDASERLRLRLQELMHEVERYRAASEDALQQLDWCIGYFTSQRQRGIAQTLSASRAQIHRDMRREALPTPTETALENG